MRCIFEQGSSHCILEVIGIRTRDLSALVFYYY